MTALDLIRLVFIDPEGRLRAGWRLLGHAGFLLIGIVVSIGIIVGATLAIMQGPAPPPMMVSLPVQAIPMCLVMLIVLALSAVVFETRWVGGIRIGHLRHVGLGRPFLRAMGELFLGALVAMLGMGITVGGMTLGGMEARLGDLDLAGLPVWLGMGVTLVFAALLEELLFRGYLFQWIGGSLARLGHWLLSLAGMRGGVVGALVDLLAFGFPVLVLSVLFGVAHLTNPSATWLAAANTVLAGIWFSVMVLRTRSLWGASIAHFVWNALMLLILGLPVSGLSEDSGVVVGSVFELTATGPEWISGGGYGPEGSVACIAGLVVMIAVSAVLPRRKAEDGIGALRRVLGERGGEEEDQVMVG